VQDYIWVVILFSFDIFGFQSDYVGNKVQQPCDGSLILGVEYLLGLFGPVIAVITARAELAERPE